MTQLALGLVNPLYQWLGDDGRPLAFGSVKTYAAGTTTPLLTYADDLLTVPNPPSVPLDALGKAKLYFQPLAYKIDVQDQFGVSIDGYPVDGIPGFSVPLVTDNSVNDFRLTLTSGVPVTTADVTGATMIFCTPSGHGNRIALFDTSGNASLLASAEFSIAVPASTSQNYDVFCYNNGGVPTLELLATSRTDMTGLTLVTTGVWTKLGDLTRRWLGSARTAAVSGQTEDSATKRFLWNYYNRAPKNLIKLGAGNWPYNTATWRQANGDTANQVETITGISDAVISARIIAYGSNSTGGASASVAFGLNSTTTPLTQQNIGVLAMQWVGVPLSCGISTIELMPAAGYNKFVWLEQGVNVATTTWFGQGSIGAGGNFQSGIFGSIWC